MSTQPTTTSNNKKRKATTTNDVSNDERFPPSPSPSRSPSPSSYPKQSPSTTTLPSHLLPLSHSSSHSHSKRTEPGLIYLSRLPPGMGPSKVKHLLQAYGEIGRVFLKRADAANQPAPSSTSSKKRQEKEKHREHKFEEGWVEFMDKRVARSVADMLNAENIGGKKGTRWRDDVWTMKYLPRFRWDMLSEQVALERATQTSLLRFHLQHSRTEQESYLSAVEKARVGRKIEEKAAGRAASKSEGDGVGVEEEGKGKKSKLAAEGAGEGEKKKKGRTYKQREVVGAKEGSSEGRRPGTKKELDDVLGRLF